MEEKIMRHPKFSAVIGTLSLTLVTLTASAQQPTTAADLAAIAQARAGMQAVSAAAQKGGVHAKELGANPDRAYPPSCLNAPLATDLYANDPNAIQASLLLPGDPLGATAAEVAYTETDTITVFRVVCSGGKSAVLMEIDRPAGSTSTLYPIFPFVYLTLSDGSQFPVRMAEDPNTFFTQTYTFQPLDAFVSYVFVLENYYGGDTQFDFNTAFSLYVDNYAAGSARDAIRFDLAAYNPSQYAEASQPLPISGYESGNWYDPAHSGEGIQVEVGELTYPSRFISIAWYTYDEMGIPYWLFGSSGFTVGDRDVIVTLGYSSGGGFAGNFGSSATTTAWGTFNVSFPNCNTMNFLYTSGSNVPSSVPQGTGSKSWTRASQLNGLTCQ
jgi:hypothetical protein